MSLGQLTENSWNGECGQLIVYERVLYQTLRRATRQGRNAIRRALGGYGREPAVGDRKLRGHVVVVVQELLVVVSHGAFADEIIGQVPATALAPLAALGVVLRRVYKTIHENLAGGGEIIPAHVAVAGEPIRREVVDAGRGELKRTKDGSLIVYIR